MEVGRFFDVFSVFVVEFFWEEIVLLLDVKVVVFFVSLLISFVKFVVLEGGVGNIFVMEDICKWFLWEVGFSDLVFVSI